MGVRSNFSGIHRSRKNAVDSGSIEWQGENGNIRDGRPTSWEAVGVTGSKCTLRTFVKWECRCECTTIYEVLVRLFHLANCLAGWPRPGWLGLGLAGEGLLTGSREPRGHQGLAVSV